MTNKRKNIMQPLDWWQAFQAEADKTHGGNVSAWLGDLGKAALPKRVAAKLSERPPANRPPKAKD